MEIDDCSMSLVSARARRISRIFGVIEELYWLPKYLLIVARKVSPWFFSRSVVSSTMSERISVRKSINVPVEVESTPQELPCIGAVEGANCRFCGGWLVCHGGNWG